MQESYDVSVLIPTRNRQKYFEQTLHEVLNQDYTGKVQVIVSVNGSKDGTAAFLQGFDARLFTDKGWSLEYVIQTKSLCIQDNWTFLLEKASAPIIAFHLDDDGWDTDYLRIGVSHLSAHPDCATCLISNRAEDHEGQKGDGWVDIYSYKVPPLVKNRIKPGVMTKEEYLGFSLFRPPFTLTQCVFRFSPRPMRREDGSHFDFAYLIARLADGNIFIDPEVHCTIRYGDGYGGGDILSSDEAHEIAISKAQLNALYDLHQGKVNASDLKDFARRRGVKCAIQYAKTLVRGRPRQEVMTLALRFAKASGGDFQLYDNSESSKDDK